MPWGHNGTGHGENPQGCVHSPKGRHIPTLISTSVGLHGSESMPQCPCGTGSAGGGGRDHSLQDPHETPPGAKTPQPVSAAPCLLRCSSPGQHHYHHQAPGVCPQICMAHTADFPLPLLQRGLPVALFNLNPQSHSRTCSALQRAELGQDV